ncbi:sulfotransferase domain-containing protein [Bradyrhizobium sp. 149]|uniref:sulfotransferase domain-containing protein n=1 Tax=Bradyrhizobium sp. 149 TaxID=2782624 RepID=UPI001FF7C9F0|nr:sulfotransferase domain-containing protein [Bradyrhizobium sp. 149]MCK1652941.1 sulfotransferase domain-containing protein [Bradyrhizobium sp. 149]
MAAVDAGRLISASAALNEGGVMNVAPGKEPGPAANIVWVASYPKSGNTWVRVFLHNLLRELSGDVEGVQDINHLYQHSLRENAVAFFEQKLGKRAAEATEVEIAKARPEVHRWLAGIKREPVFVKTHLQFCNDHLYPTINLDVMLAAILVVRNPLDVVISMSHHSALSIEDAIRQMATRDMRWRPHVQRVYEVLGSWSQSVASWLSLTDRPVYMMRYEDMLEDPQQSFAGLARFLRLAPSDGQLQRAIAKSSFAVLQKQEVASGFIERPESSQQFFREGRAGQWREVLSGKQIEEICAVHASMMQRCGYLHPDCGRPVLLATPAARQE